MIYAETEAMAMDYKQYITEIEKQLHNMSEDEKDQWIYDQARIVNEEKRQDFLDSLMEKKMSAAELTPEEINDWCCQVDEGEICLESSSYESYQEGAWDSDWITEYHDTQHAMPHLVKVINACREMVMLSEYKTVFPLLDRICRLEFPIDSDEEYFWDDEVELLTLEDLVREELVSINFRELSLCLLYSCYQTHKGKNRINLIHEYLTWDMCKNISVTDIFSFGPEQIKDEDSFMQEWCSFLQQVHGDRTAELLTDACIYLGGDSFLLETAQANIEIHPSLYLQYCERKYKCGEYKACIETAREAVNRLDKDKAIRADLADLAIHAAKESGDTETMEQFYFDAFYSQPNAWHLLRLYQLNDAAVLTCALTRVCGMDPAPFSGNQGSHELREAAITDKDHQTIYRFLLGDYEEILEHCKKNKEYLGWSKGVKNIIIRLLLLYLKEDKKEKTNAEKNLIENMRHELSFGSTAEMSFDECLSLWRNNYKIAEDHQQMILSWLQDEIDKRAEAVVGGGFRHSYYKAAELIVVLGSILEERGTPDGKMNLIEHYKKLHSRKRAFRSEIDQLAH